MSAAAGTESAWARAARAAALFAIDPLQSGVALRAGPGPARDAWLALLRDLLPPGAPIRRAPAGVGDDRLLGGLDLAETLRAGRTVAETGLMAQAHGGVLQLAMAERLDPAAAARVGIAMDLGEICVERDGLALRRTARFGVVALDEGCCDDERPPEALLDRLAFHVDLAGVGHREIEQPVHKRRDVLEARARLPHVRAGSQAIETLAAVAARLGVVSLRAPLLALRVARALCALRGADAIDGDDVAAAARYVLAPRAAALPAAEEPPAPPEAGETPPDGAGNEPPPESAGRDDRGDAPAPSLEEIVLAATAAAIPKDLLARIEAGTVSRAKSAHVGKSGSSAASAKRGRPLGGRGGQLREGRLGLVETLRAAAPWQGFRRKTAGENDPRRVLVRPEDFRIRRYRERRESTAIFVVDASGSAALQRLAEAKGAIELLLADCYVRRDNVALVAFRGAGAELALPPTRSLTRAKRALAGLPGGGGTPLAAGLESALGLAQSLARKGQSPLLVVMTDGRANVRRDGQTGRGPALEDALAVGRLARAAGVAALAIDTAPAIGARAEPPTLKLAQAMNARYVKLPHVNAAGLSAVVRAVAPAS